MTVFLDSNIVLDIFLKNKDFYDESKEVLSLADSGTIDFFISAASIADIYSSGGFNTPPLWGETRGIKSDCNTL